MDNKNYRILGQAIVTMKRSLDHLKKLDVGDNKRLARIQGHVIVAYQQLTQIHMEVLDDERRRLDDSSE